MRRLVVIWPAPQARYEESVSMLPSIHRVVELLGGEVTNGEALVPGPGHSARDRSLAVKIDPKAPGGLLVHSFAGDDPIACKNYVLGRLGIERRPEKTKRDGGKPYSPIVARYTYRNQYGVPYLQVTRTAAKQFLQYHWDGETWRPGRPRGPKIPYRLPELLAASPTTRIYLTEGEKCADALAACGFTSTTVSEGANAPWDSAVTPHFADRHVIILVDADRPGRKHGEKIAKALDGKVASLKVVDLFPDRHDGSDVADFLKDDPSGARLHKLVAEMVAWEPKAQDADAIICELASLSTVEYERRRKAEAEQLGVRVTELDRLVAKALGDVAEAARASALYPHWNVEPAVESVDGNEMMRALIETIRRYVFLSEDQAVAVALWIIFTWCHDVMTHSPLLFVTSAEADSGKTTLLGVVSFLVRKGMTSVEASGPALFRSIKKWSPCFVVDEADDALKDNPDLRSVVNSGWTIGSGVVRCHSETLDPEVFSTFTPKGIGMKGRALPDTTLSRSIIITMRPRRAADPAEHVEDFNHLDNDGFADLRSQLMRWAADHSPALADAKPETPPNFRNRRRANWRCLLSIGERVGWRDAAWKAALAVEAVRDSFDPSIGVQLLLAIKERFIAEETDRITSKAMQAALIEDETGPWVSFGKAGKPITENGIARLLKAFGIRPRTIRVPGDTAKGYQLSWFQDAFERHIPSVPASPDLRTVTPSQTSNFKCLDEKKTVTPHGNVTDQNPPRPLENDNCDGVTDENGLTGQQRRVRCAQCGGEPDGTERLVTVGDDTVWLHEVCVRFYRNQRAGR